MSLGASLFDLFNRRRPADAVMAAGKGDQPGVPPDPEATGSTGQAQQAPPPNAVGNGQTPPDLGAMYEQLVKRQESARSIDSGMTLMAAGLAHDQNRASLINLAGQEGGRGMSSPESVVKTLSEIQQQKDAAANFAQMGKNLGAIGQQYGLDSATVEYLHRSGKLQETLGTLAKGETEVVEAADGSKQLIDKRTGKKLSDLTPAKSKEYKYEKGPGGSIIAIDPTMDPADPKSRTEVAAPSTDDIIEYNAAKAAAQKDGKTDFPDLMQWILATKKAGASSTNVSVSGDKKGAEEVSKEFGKIIGEEYKQAQSAGETIGGIQNAHNQVDANEGIITGSSASPYVLEGRKVIANMLGLDDKKADNTDVFNSSIRSIVIPKLKNLGAGSGLSDNDVKFLNQMYGGSGTISKDAIKQILLMQEKVERYKILKYNDKVTKVKAEQPDMYGSALQSEVPRPSSQLIATVPEPSIEFLKKNGGDKKTIRDFNKKYGPGMAEFFLTSSEED